MIGRKSLVAICAGTVAMSGVFGFGGAYMANTINGGESAAVAESGSSSDVSVANISAEGDSEEQLSISEVYEKNGESVVEITTETKQFDRMMGQYVSSGAGSGVIISSDGYIVTNNHVIDGASKINVRLKDGETLQAELVGKDSKTDMAVIKVDGESFKPAEFGNSDSLLVGETVVAIGNPLGELGGTVTEGIISALDRDIVIGGESMNLLQISAAVNPGNSGGGLFNQRGELIGVVNAKSSGSDIEGLGFAIPANTAKRVAEQIIDEGYVSGRPELGVSLVEILDEMSLLEYKVSSPGVYVREVTRQNGLEPGDRIVSADGKTVEVAQDVKDAIESKNAGDVIKMTVERDGETVDISSKLSESRD